MESMENQSGAVNIPDVKEIGLSEEGIAMIKRMPADVDLETFTQKLATLIAVVDSAVHPLNESIRLNDFMVSIVLKCMEVKMPDDDEIRWPEFKLAQALSYILKYLHDRDELTPENIARAIIEVRDQC
jgi:hypothetical protein